VRHFIIRSEEELADLYPAGEVAARARPKVTIEILAAGGHYYVGGEELVSARVVAWLADRVEQLS